MNITMLKSKIHRATVTEAKLDYVGSITIDASLLEKSGILEYEKVQIANVTNGARLETYTIAGERGSGVICLNGAAAHLAQKGDIIIIMAYTDMTEEEAKTHRPKVVFVDSENNIKKVASYEKCGALFQEEIK